MPEQTTEQEEQETKPEKREPFIIQIEREFPLTTKIGKIIGKIVRGIGAFFYSLGHAMMTEDKKPKKNGKQNGNGGGKRTNGSKGESHVNKV